MADFLSRLVERSAGTAPVARPVAAPLFAPGPAMAADPAAEELEPVGVLTQDPAPVSAPTPMAPTSIPREAAAMGSAMLRPVRASARPASATPVGTALGAIRPAAAVPPESPRPVLFDEERRPRVEGLPVAAPPLSPSAQNLAAVPRRPPGSQDSQRGEAQSPGVTAPLLRPREEVVPRWTEAVRPRGPGGESPAPVVRISIGRIEVRAVTPPGPAAPRPTPARKSTGLSLEEYLRPRSRVR